MGAESLDQGLEPIAQLLLLVILMLMVAGAASYLLNKYVQRQKEKAHNKLSKSRRTKDTGIDLFAQRNDDPLSQAKSRRTSKSRNSGFNILQVLKDLAFKLDASKGRHRRKHSKKRRHRSSSTHLSIDITQNKNDLADASEPPQANTPNERAS